MKEESKRITSEQEDKMLDICWTINSLATMLKLDRVEGGEREFFEDLKEDKNNTGCVISNMARIIQEKSSQLSEIITDELETLKEG